MSVCAAISAEGDEALTSPRFISLSDRLLDSRIWSRTLDAARDSPGVRRRGARRGRRPRVAATIFRRGSGTVGGIGEGERFRMRGRGSRGRLVMVVVVLDLFLWCGSTGGKIWGGLGGAYWLGRERSSGSLTCRQLLASSIHAGRRPSSAGSSHLRLSRSTKFPMDGAGYSVGC